MSAGCFFVLFEKTYSDSADRVQFLGGRIGGD